MRAFLLTAYYLLKISLYTPLQAVCSTFNPTLMIDLEKKMKQLHGDQWKAQLLKSFLEVTVDVVNNPNHADGLPAATVEAINDLWAIARAITE